MKGLAPYDLSILSREVKVARDNVDMMAETWVIFGERELGKGESKDGQEEEKEAHEVPWVGFKEIICVIKCLMVNSIFYTGAIR